MPSLMAVLGLNWSGFKSGADAAAGYSRGAGAKIASAFGSQIQSSLASIVSVGALTGLAKSTINYGHDVQILSDRLGISTDAVQRFDYALQLNGTSLDSNAKSFSLLAKSREKALKGNSDTIASFRQLGVSVDDLKNKRLEDVFAKIARAFETGDPQKLLAPFRTVAGRGSDAMIAAFANGFSEMGDEAERQGLIIGERTVKGLSRSEENWKQFWMRGRAAAAPMLGMLGEYMDWDQTLRRGASAGWKSFRAGEGWSAGVEKWAAEEAEAQADAAARADKRKKSMIGGGDEESAAKTKEADERQRLAERLRNLQNKNYLETLTKEQQITELYRRRVELSQLLSANWMKLSDAGRLKAIIDLETIMGEEEAAKRGLVKPGGLDRGRGNLDLNALQRIGAYTPGITGTDKAILNIDHNVRRIADRPPGASEPGGF